MRSCAWLGSTTIVCTARRPRARAGVTGRVGRSAAAPVASAARAILAMALLMGCLAVVFYSADSSYLCAAFSSVTEKATYTKRRHRWQKRHETARLRLSCLCKALTTKVNLHNRSPLRQEKIPRSDQNGT